MLAAEYAGLKDLIPPYLDPNVSLQEMMTGVSFASAGSGFDPVTPKFSVLTDFWYLFLFSYSVQFNLIYFH